MNEREAEIAMILAFDFRNPEDDGRWDGLHAIQDNELSFEVLASKAVHHCNENYREFLRRKAIELLADGSDLPKALRAWLVFVLQNAEKIPHKSGGGYPMSPDEVLRIYEALAQAVLQYKSNPPKGRHSKLSEIAGILEGNHENKTRGRKKCGEDDGDVTMSEGKIKYHLYSNGFRVYCDIYHTGLDIAPKKRQAKKNGPTKEPAKKGQ